MVGLPVIPTPGRTWQQRKEVIDVDLTVHTVDHTDAKVVSVGGELDALSAPDLDSALTSATTHPRPCLVVDLSEVTFMDSTGLGVLIKAARASAESQIEFSVVVTSPRVRKLLTITGMEGPLSVTDSLAAARAHCGQRS